MVEPGEQGRGVRRWLLLGAVVLLALVLVGVAGGFRRVPETQGRRAEIGQEIVLARWRLVIERLELTNRTAYDTDTPPTVQLHLRATFTGDASTYGLSAGMLEVQAAGGPAGIEKQPMTDGERDATFDPDVAQEISLAYLWPTAPAAAPADLRVLIRDEEETVNYLFPSGWAVGPQVDLHVDLACEDRRVTP